MHFRPGPDEIRQIARMALASAVAWGAGNLLGAPRPTFAVLAVIITLTGNAPASLRTGAHRLIGVAGGVAIGLLAVHGPGLNAVVVGLVVLLALLLGSRLRFGPQLNTQVAISALLLLAGGGGLAYGLERLWETAMGGAAAVLASLLLWPADPVATLAATLARLRQQLAEDLRALPAALEGQEARAYLQRVRPRSRAAEAAAQGLPELEDALGWTPWRAQTGFERCRDAVLCLAALYRHVRTLARCAADAQSAGPGPALARLDLLQAATDTLAANALEVLDPAGNGPVSLGQAEDRARAWSVTASGPLAGAVTTELGHLRGDLHRPGDRSVAQAGLRPS